MGEQVERRKGYVEIDPSLLRRVEEHLESFEERRTACREILSAGRIRMDNIEVEMAKMTALINTADGFIKATRLVAAIVSVLMAALVGVVVWIATEKNADMRDVKLELQAHAIQINRTLSVVERMATAQDRAEQRMERHLDSVNEDRRNR